MATGEGDMIKPNTVFEDVFRRADKNDDGAISWDEFKVYFDDGVCDKEELKTLFNEIDTHNTNNIDVGELCEFFKTHLGPFADIFKSLDDLTKAVSCALVQSHQKYSSSSLTEQFATRFLLREVLKQFGFQQHHIELASDKIDEDEKAKRPDLPIVNSSDTSSGRGGRMLRKMRSYVQQTSLQPSPGLEAEIDRLSELIDRLDSRVKFDVVEEEIVDESTSEPLELLCRKFTVVESAVGDFKAFLRSYLFDLKKNEGSVSTSVRIREDQHCFTLYEVWKNSTFLRKHLVSKCFRTFQKQTIDCVTRPEDFSSMPLPGKP